MPRACAPAASVRSGLLYLKGGYSQRPRDRLVSVTTPRPRRTTSRRAATWTAGTSVRGYALPISATTYAKIDYVFTNYSINDDGFGVDANLQRHRGLVGFGYRF